jgi:hypothetical protein
MVLLLHNQQPCPKMRPQSASDCSSVCIFYLPTTSTKKGLTKKVSIEKGLQIQHLANTNIAIANYVFNV